jgi:glycosyltransferase involved in cell wall biosynthesis
MKIAVYAICKNEAKFAKRWADSMREADQVVVLDTGSTDDTVEILRRAGVQVTEETITPWRFDTARNRALELVDSDVDLCICTDLDEVFSGPWRQAVEQAWTPDIRWLRCRFVWSYQPDGSEGMVYWHTRIHPRHGYRWIHPVHEVLDTERTGRTVDVQGVSLCHHADPDKPRKQYLPLLELAVREEPNCERNVHYLGREYLYYSRWDDCIRTLKRYLSMPQAKWLEERCASMRYIGRSYLAKGERETAMQWFLRAAAEMPTLREPWMDLAMCGYRQEDWALTEWAARRCLGITERSGVYVNEAEAWGAEPWDLLSLALYYTGRVAEARQAAERAVELAPWDERIARNLAFMQA